MRSPALIFSRGGDHELLGPAPARRRRGGDTVRKSVEVKRYRFGPRPDDREPLEQVGRLVVCGAKRIVADVGAAIAGKKGSPEDLRAGLLALTAVPAVRRALCRNQDGEERDDPCHTAVPTHFWGPANRSPLGLPGRARLAAPVPARTVDGVRVGRFMGHMKAKKRPTPFPRPATGGARSSRPGGRVPSLPKLQGLAHTQHGILVDPRAQRHQQRDAHHSNPSEATISTVLAASTVTRTGMMIGDESGTSEATTTIVDSGSSSAGKATRYETTNTRVSTVVEDCRSS